MIDSIVKFVLGKVRLIGDTDATLIGNIGDRLKVSTVPASNVVYQHAMLLNAGAYNMNVNGATVNVNYDYAPASGETVYLERLSCVLGDAGTPDFNEFGSLGAALTNGCQLLIRSNGTEYIFDTIKDNMAINQAFSDTAYYPTTLAWFNETDMFQGTIQFNQPIVLKQSTSDYVRLKVRDNLTAITFFSISAKVWKVI